MLSIVNYKIKSLAIVLLCLCSNNISAQQTNNSAAIALNLEKIKNVGTVLYIAAHPDDENTKLLAYLANERKFRTGYLSLTRGDGGQNLIGKEQGVPLGLIRTQELLAARKIDGATQFFTRAYDFGYSKNPEETFQFWNRDSVLSDVVWVIRNFKPDVIICRFPTTGEGGHGHHTASAMLAVDAFKKSNDPNFASHQLKYTSLWQAKRIFWNTFNFGGLNTTNENQLKIDVGNFNPLIGKSYGEIAAESRTMHKSQGFGTTHSRGTSFEYFKWLDGDTAVQDIFEGIKTDWDRYAFLKPFKNEYNQIVARFSIQNPEKSISDLVSLYRKIEKTKTTDEASKYWKAIKLKELQECMLQCAGWWCDANSNMPSIAKDGELKIQLQCILRNATNLKIISAQCDAEVFNVDSNLKRNQNFNQNFSIKISQNHTLSDPYWLVNKHSRGLFQVDDLLQLGQPENASAFSVNVNLSLQGLPLSVEIPVRYKKTDPIRGDVFSAVQVLPEVTLQILDPIAIFRNNEVQKISVLVKSNASNQNGQLTVSNLKGWKIEEPLPAFNLPKTGDEELLHFNVYPTNESEQENSILINAKTTTNTFSKTVKNVRYDHIPEQFYLEDATVKLVKLNIQKAGNRIGYIQGAGDDIAECLQKIGYQIEALDEEKLNKIELKKFDAIIAGVRAYNTQPYLGAMHQKLMEYVKDGGNYIVQYNTNNRISSVPTLIGPYAFEITRDRVTDENAEVVFSMPNHPLLNYPNKITHSDFNGWIQERGVYFAKDSLGKYQKPLAMHDVGEKDMNGSVLIAPYGKGTFVYTGLAFFRQLPAGVPGAYKLLVNMMSLPNSK